MRLPIGSTFSTTRTFSHADVAQAALLGSDREARPRLPWADGSARLVPAVAGGMLLQSALAGALAEYFPGAIQRAQSLIFLAPVAAVEPLTIALVVRAISSEGELRLDAVVSRPDGVVACQGEMVVGW